MVYLHFPTNLTEEELMLQTKYAKLKKKVSNIPLRNISKNITLKCCMYCWFISRCLVTYMCYTAPRKV